jgi:CRP-like cAMP-binding protein
MASAGEKQAEGKSGLRRLRPSEILFNDGELANSLYIIQKGQLRLFKPKGKGFIEIAVLRTGEVIGEMAYFDQTGGGKRSCSAMAMVSSEVIEISFTAFAKTMSALNPWFKTIITTLADRLRATNGRVKELENNSASVNYGSGKHVGYEFLKTNDIIKVLGTLFLVYKSHGEKHAEGIAVHKKTLDLYSHEIFGIIEAKFDEMMIVLQDINILKIENDKDGMPKVYVIRNIDAIRSFFIFYNSEKHLTEDKKLKVGKKGQVFLEAIWKKLADSPGANGEMVQVEIASLLEGWKANDQHIDVQHLDEAKQQGIVTDAMLGAENALMINVDYVKLNKLLPNIQIRNRIITCNEEKSTYA